VLILRIRQAECALADGRLDEVFDIASADDVRQHRNGQRLIGKLIEQLISRSQSHCDAECYQQSLSDSRATKVGLRRILLAIS